MFKKVLLATDFSPAASLLVSCVGELQVQGMEELILLHVIDEEDTDIIDLSPERLNACMGEEKAHLEEQGVNVTCQISHGIAAKEILVAAQEHDVDLVIMGSRGQSRLRDYFLGNTVSQFIRITTVPTLLERIKSTGETDELTHELVCTNKLSTLLMATDLSDAAKSAEQAALALAKHASKVILLTVIDEGETVEEVKQIQLEKTAQLYKLKQAFQDILPHVVTKVEVGIPSEYIADIAKQDGASLIITGMRGKGRLRNILLGSTAEAVSRRSETPVLLVPSPKK